MSQHWQQRRQLEQKRPHRQLNQRLGRNRQQEQNQQQALSRRQEQNRPQAENRQQAEKNKIKVSADRPNSSILIFNPFGFAQDKFLIFDFRYEVSC
jgi:hypothetical protein